MSHHNGSHNDKTKKSVQYDSFFSTWVTNPFNIFKLKKKFFCRLIENSRYCNLPSVLCIKRVIIQTSKVLWLKILFHFLSFDSLSIQCSARWYGGGMHHKLRVYTGCWWASKH